MKLTPLKGLITEIDDEYAVVEAEKGHKEYRFSISSLPDVSVNDKITLLIKPSEDEFGISQVLFVKSLKKVKPFKMPSYTTLLGHMIKIRSRLKATLDENADSDQIDDIQAKIDWLTKGIDLFS